LQLTTKKTLRLLQADLLTLGVVWADYPTLNYIKTQQIGAAVAFLGLVHRLFHLHKPSMVSWEQLSNQFGHNYREPRTFRRFFLDSLKRVSAVYPEAKLNVGASGVLLLPSRPHLAKAAVPAKR
jgi:hypothetical protein